jgi:hypothetical protein
MTAPAPRRLHCVVTFKSRLGLCALIVLLYSPLIHKTSAAENVGFVHLSDGRLPGHSTTTEFGGQASRRDQAPRRSGINNAVRAGTARSLVPPTCLSAELSRCRVTW